MPARWRVARDPCKGSLFKSNEVFDDWDALFRARNKGNLGAAADEMLRRKARILTLGHETYGAF
jgi:hypothetical protein